MVPVEISQEVQNLTNQELAAKLEFRSYTFCVNTDYTNEKAVMKMAVGTEELLIEALQRIMESKLGYRPFQNKLYEKVEYIFENQDAYNINRLLSTMRRMKTIPVNYEDDKYMMWLRNRIKYSIVSINRSLEMVPAHA